MRHGGVDEYGPADVDAAVEVLAPTAAAVQAAAEIIVVLWCDRGAAASTLQGGPRRHPGCPAHVLPFAAAVQGVRLGRISAMGSAAWAAPGGILRGAVCVNAAGAASTFQLATDDIMPCTMAPTACGWDGRCWSSPLPPSALSPCSRTAPRGGR